MMVDILDEKGKRGLIVQYELNRFCANHNIRIDSIIFTQCDNPPTGKLMCIASPCKSQWSGAWNDFKKLKVVK